MGGGKNIEMYLPIFASLTQSWRNCLSLIMDFKNENFCFYLSGLFKS